MNQDEFSKNNLKMQAQLRVLLDLVIPASRDGSRPSAVMLGVDSELLKVGQLEELADGLMTLENESQARFQRAFLSLSHEHHLELLQALRSKLRPFFNRLSKSIFQIYYQKDNVLEAIGLGARPPFPEGYHVLEGDLSLLEMVYERGEIFKKV